MRASDHVVGDLCKTVDRAFGDGGIGRDERKRGIGAVMQLSGARTCTLEPEERHPGGLVVLLVLAGGLAEGGRVLRRWGC